MLGHFKPNHLLPTLLPIDYRFTGTYYYFNDVLHQSLNYKTVLRHQIFCHIFIPLKKVLTRQTISYHQRCTIRSNPRMMSTLSGPERYFHDANTCRPFETVEHKDLHSIQFSKVVLVILTFPKAMQALYDSDLYAPTRNIRDHSPA